VQVHTPPTFQLTSLQDVQLARRTVPRCRVITSGKLLVAIVTVSILLQGCTLVASKCVTDRTAIKACMLRYHCCSRLSSHHTRAATFMSATIAHSHLSSTLRAPGPSAHPASPSHAPTTRCMLLVPSKAWSANSNTQRSLNTDAKLAGRCASGPRVALCSEGAKLVTELSHARQMHITPGPSDPLLPDLSDQTRRLDTHTPVGAPPCAPVPQQGRGAAQHERVACQRSLGKNCASVTCFGGAAQREAQVRRSTTQVCEM
jgi:hypothetical protein